MMSLITPWSRHVGVWELDRKEGWVLKNWCLRTVALEKIPETPLHSKEISLKGNQPWILVGRTDAKAETPGFRSSDANNWLTGKVPDAGNDWGQKEKTASEDEMAGSLMQWTWTRANLKRQWGEKKRDRDSEGQRGLACCSPWGRKESRLGD